MSDLFQKLKGNFQDEDYRHIYTNGLIDSKIATQLKVLREQPGREWTQDVLAEKTGMRQARISALEDVNYSAWTLSTLRRFARVFDLYVDVELKEFGTLKPQLEELDREHLSRRSFNDDPAFSENPRVEEMQPSEAVMKAVSGLVQVSTSPKLAVMAGVTQESSTNGTWAGNLLSGPKKPKSDFKLLPIRQKPEQEVQSENAPLRSVAS